MSSVTSKNSSGSDEAVIKAREEYRKKEAELVKKHNKEIQALQERYIQELDKKDRVNTEMLKGAREKSQDSLTRKDMRYQKEMEDLRRMHTKQLEKLMQDNRDRLETQVKTSRSEVKQANLGKKDRETELHNRYEGQSAAEAQKFSEKLQELREDQKETIGEIRSKLNTAHEKELEYLHDDRNEAVSQLKNDYRKLRQSSQERIKNQETRHMNDKLRMQSSHMDNIHRETEMHNKIQEISREGYQDGLKEVRNRLARAREEDLQKQSAINSDFKSSVDDRVTNQVNRLERDLSKARNANVMDRAAAERDADRQVANMRDAYQEKFNYLEKAREETLRQSNDINAANTKKVHEDANKQMANNTRYYISRMELENLKNRQALESAEQDFALRQDYTAENAESRINRIRSQADSKEKSLRENFSSNVTVLRTTNEEEKKDMRLALHKETEERLALMKEQFQKQEVEHQRKQADVALKYEKQIESMNDQFNREKRLRDNREKRLVNELKRSHDAQIEALKSKYEDQNKETQVALEREKREVTRRYEEKLNDVLSTMKKT